MNTYLLTWNTIRWNDWKDIEKKARDTASGKAVEDRWSCGVTKNLETGSRVFIIKLGDNPKGIVASGWTTSRPYYAETWDQTKAVQGSKSLYIDCEWERLLNPDVDDLLPLLKLPNTPTSFNWTPQAGGVQIPYDLAEKLEKMWAEYVGGSSLGSVDIVDELSIVEGETRLTLVRHRRRERAIREAKLKEALANGDGRLRCEVPNCGFDFYDVYGELGLEFSHIHHLKPLGDRTMPSATRLDELAIVCANCHSMIHRNGACRPLEGLIQKPRV